MAEQLLIKCYACGWVRATTGNPDEVKDLYEVSGCASCSGKKYRCPQCGRMAKVQKVRVR